MIKKSTFIFFLISLIAMNSCDKEDLAFDLPKVIKLPSLITYDISNIQSNSASCNSEITFDGGAPITASGICYATTINPTIANNILNSGTNWGTFYTIFRDLSPNTTYYVRAFATNSAGTGYGNQMVFKTLSTIATVTTTPITNITAFTAIGGGNVSTDGGATVNARGVCYSTYSNPTVANNYVTSGSGIGPFTANLTGLLPNTTYYARAFAQNEMGMAYGSQYSFTTSSALPIVTTASITNITISTATGGGNVTDSGNSAVLNRGVCYATSSNPTTNNSYVLSGTGIGAFTSNLTGLLPNTTYYVRAFAINSNGTAYGTQYSFKTLPAIASLTTISVTNITASTAASGGIISSDGGASITNRGICWSNTTSTPTTSNTYTTTGSGTGSFSAGMTSLQPNTTYYVRAFAINSTGTSYGNTVSFTTTSVSLPSLITNSITSITSSSAASGGNITSDGGASVTSRGVCWSNTTSSPTISNSRTTDGSGTGSFASSITGLSPSTTYYVRSYATNAAGTSYGSVISFTTSTSALVVGQSYQGGIIAYIYQSGDTGYIAGQTHGLIVTTSNQSTGAQWGCSGTSISTSLNIGTGQSNTTAIVNSCTTSSIAARICNDLVSGGYSDWYLPSYYELQKLYSNRTAIGGFSNANYWSSSQSSSTLAYTLNLYTGVAIASNKSSGMYVRAIRKF